jgi:hypothetical protein
MGQYPKNGILLFQKELHLVTIQVWITLGIQHQHQQLAKLNGRFKMSHIPIQSTNQSIFAIETGFDSVLGVQDPVYNPRILAGLEVHQFFTRQVHYVGKYIEGVSVSTNGISLPVGYYFLLDPYMYYSSGTTYNATPYFTWNIDGVDTIPRFQSHYMSDQPTGSNASYRGLRFVDCSTSSKTLKIVARGAGWASMGNVYFDNQQTTAAATATHKSHIDIYAIDASTYQNPTVTVLDASNSTGSWGSAQQMPESTLNKFWVNTVSFTQTFYAPIPTQAGDWFGFMQMDNSTTQAITITSPPSSQTLVSSVTGSHGAAGNARDMGARVAWKWVWSGIRWL